MPTQDRKALKQYFRNTLMFAGILVLCLGCFYSVLAWTEPSQTAPLGNTPTPLNVGTTAQTKTGSLRTNGELTVIGASYLSTTNVYDNLTISSGKSLCLGTDCRTTWPSSATSSIETDPTVPSAVKAITSTQITNWDSVYTTAVRSIIAGTGVTVSRVGNDVTVNATGGAGLPSGTNTQTLRHNGTTWVANNALLSDGASATANGNFFVNSNLTVTGTGSFGGQTISSATITNWNNAFAWGSHAIACPAGQAVTTIVAGGATLCAPISGTGIETDPTVPSAVKAITSTQITNWDSVYTTAVRSIIAGTGVTVSRVGNDVTVNATGGAGLPSGTNTQTLRHNGTTWVANNALLSDGASATANGNFFVNSNLTVTGTGSFGGQTISSATITNWNNAFAWGSHAIACPAGQAVTTIVAGGASICAPISGTGIETDPVWLAQKASYATQAWVTGLGYTTQAWVTAQGYLTAASTLAWSKLAGFPAACSAGQYVSAVGSTLTCSTPAGSGAWTVSGNDIYNSNSGNVGIGTGAIVPGANLHVYNAGTGVVKIEGATAVASRGAILDLEAGAGRAKGTIMANWFVGVPYAAWSDETYVIGYDASSPENLVNAKFSINTSGNVGIGIAPTTYKLDVSGTINASNALCVSANCFNTTNIGNWNTAFGWGNHALAGYLTAASSLAWNKLTGSPIACDSGKYVSAIVNGVLTCSIPAGSGTWTVSGANIYNSNTSGNVGIGNVNPTSLLTLGGYSGADLLFPGGGNNTQSITMSTDSGTFSIMKRGSGYAGRVEVNGGAYPMFLYSSAFANGLTIATTDNVGIGTTNPGTNKLQVTGGQLRAENGLTVVGTSYLSTSQFTGPVKIADGTQGLNEVLTSDASGNASWQTLSSIPGMGDITAVNTTAGSGLIGGAITGDVTLNIDSAILQKRVISTCTGINSSIKTINADGSVTCETDDVGGTVGPGTTNRIAKFTGASAISDSIITDNGTNLSLTNAVGSYGAGRIQVNNSGDLIGLTLNSTSRVWDLISIVSTASDYFAIRDNTAGVNRLTINDTGNVGIGSLTVTGTGTFGGQTVSSATITNWNNAVQNIIAGTGVTVSRAGNDVTVNVASGAGLPTGVNTQTLRHNGTTWVANNALLSDGVSATADGNLFVTGILDIKNGNGYEINFSGAASANIYNSSGDILLLAGVGKSLQFGSNGINSQMVLNSGSLGIGTVTPSTVLSLGTSLGMKLAIYDSGSSATSYGFGVQSGRMFAQNSAGTEVMNWTSGGNVGIGTIPTTYKLDVLGQINASAGLCIAGSCKTDWNSVSGPWTIGTGNIYYNGGNVGIGTNNPTSPAGVTRFLNISDPTHAGITLTDTAPTAGSWDIWTNDGVLYTWHNSIYGLIINATGNVGIGDTTPSFKLDVTGQINATAGLCIAGSCKVVWPTAGMTKTEIEAATFTTLTATKLNVTTIDPIYEIDGEKYATYVADFAGGVRIETSGILRPLAQNDGFESIIDFNNSTKGGDLWLFWQASNKKINDLVVILTPGFAGKAWYEKQNNKIVIYSDQEGEVSYRLTLPREDAAEWPNKISK